ncbi:hypothetical protein [Rhizobium leguminosarum]|uniref:hypothetical protein n=1 Tax=Rhizobium leguminosarum TaxID=384 RepID=UPI001C8FC999|nr:hypothetical protein [Rhizobium leguminosarum]MBY2908567.1 hypothetical protein [Rhizobium leguminosarum]
MLAAGPAGAADAAKTSAAQIGKPIPMAAAPFNGKIGLSYKDSEADFPQPVSAAATAVFRFKDSRW